MRDVIPPLLACLLSAFLAFSARAEKIKNGTRVLSFEFSSQYEHPYANPVKRSIEFVLNDLGLVVDYWDLDKKAFTGADAKKLKSAGYAGLITCFHNEGTNRSRHLMDALMTYSESGLPWASLCHMGFLDELGKKTLLQQKAFWSPWGMSPQPALSGWPRPYLKRPEFFGFEKKAFESIADVLPLRGTDPKQTVLASVQTQGKISERVQALIGPKFSVAHVGFGLSMSGEGEQRSWNVNPYLFFQKAFKLDLAAPIPDASVLNGNRVFMVHVDADGFNAATKNRFGFAGTRSCGDVLGAQIVGNSPGIPMGISVILSEVMDEELGNADTEAAVHRIFASPNVEPALHSYRHPLFWPISEYPRLKSAASYGALDIPLETETALKIFEERYLKPSGKTQKVYYWTGNCMPPDSVVEKIEKAGYKTINGGDTRWDDHYSSMSSLSPLGRQLPKGFQVFSGSSNDNIYTDGWRIPISAYAEVQRTIDLTEGKNLGRIALKPIDLYFHSFALETIEGQKLIQNLIHENYSRKVSPVFPSSYIDAAYAAHRAQISHDAASAWSIKEIQGLRTIRVHQSQWPALDWEKSSGVIGQKRVGDWLYLNLKPGIDSVKLVQGSRKASGSPFPLLVDLEGELTEWNLNFGQKKLKLRTSEWAKGEMTLELPAAPKRVQTQGMEIAQTWDAKTKRVLFKIQSSPQSKGLELEW